MLVVQYWSLKLDGVWCMEYGVKSHSISVKCNARLVVCPSQLHHSPCLAGSSEVCLVGSSPTSQCRLPTADCRLQTACGVLHPRSDARKLQVFVNKTRLHTEYPYLHSIPIPFPHKVIVVLRIKGLFRWGTCGRCGENEDDPQTVRTTTTSYVVGIAATIFLLVV